MNRAYRGIVSPKMPLMVAHPKTDEAVHQFVSDFEKWLR